MSLFRLLSVLPGLVCLLACSPGATEATEWNTVFHPLEGSGWCGGDAAYSVELPNDRTLWLFGDTLIGEVRDGVRSEVEPRFGNSMALQELPPIGVSPSRPRFEWGPPGSRGWLPIHDGTLSGPEAPATLGTAMDAGQPLVAWPQHGAVIGEDLVLFHAAVTSGGCADCGIFDFETHGATVSVVSGVDRPYDEWGVTAAGWSAEALPTQSFVPEELGADILWGAWILPFGSDVLVYGSRERAAARDVLLARIPDVRSALDLFAFDQWVFWQGTGWTRDVTEATPVATETSSEISLVAIPEVHGGGGFAMVHGGADPLSPSIVIAVSAAPWGPFEQAYAVRLMDISRALEPTSTFSYAIKAHGHLSTEEDLLVSYVTLPATTLAEPSVPDAMDHYVPRFLNVPWAEL